MIVIFDLDGTLALIDHRRPLVECDKPDWDAFYRACVDDRPNDPVISVMRAMVVCDWDVEIWSGRSDIVRAETERWLDCWTSGISAPLRMRADGDFTPDEQLKKRWLDEVGAHNVHCVFDDRDKVVRMWRENGVPCFQVAPGSF